MLALPFEKMENVLNSDDGLMGILWHSLEHAKHIRAEIAELHRDWFR